MISNCKHERNGTCIPADLNQCTKCNYFILDPKQCNNYNTILCKIDVDKQCPCNNFAHLDN